MAIHTRESVQILHSDPDTCWRFFSDPRNLDKITPPELDFQIRSQLPDEVYEGLMIVYKVRPLFGIQMTWVTEITHVRRPHYFADEQRVGPYGIWHHEHFFRNLGDGRIEARDLVHYSMPFGPIGDLFEPLLVRPQLDAIFKFRETKIGELFAENPPANPRLV